MIEGKLRRAPQEIVAYARYWGRLGQARLTHRTATILKSESSSYDRRALAVTWFSPTLGVTKQLHLYLPPNYDTSHERYPVLYLLRGHEREWLNTAEDHSRQGRNVIDVYEHLLAAGRVRPMILVMPGMTSDDGTVHGLGIDLLKPWRGQQVSGTGTGMWESYLRHDVIPLVDTHWRTLASGAHRGVDGFSLGGAMALKFAAKFPGLFRTAGAYDGTFLYTTPDGGTVRPDDQLLNNALFEPAFGRQRNLRYAAANNAANLLLTGNLLDLQHVTWMVQYGPAHIEPWGSNYYRGEHVTEIMAQRGIRNTLGEPVLFDGEHTWATADRHMAQTLPIHSTVLQG